MSKNKLMFFMGPGSLLIKKGDQRLAGDPVDIEKDGLDEKTVKRMVANGRLVESKDQQVKSPSIAESRAQVSRLEGEKSELKDNTSKLLVKNSSLVDKIQELQESIADIEQLKSGLEKREGRLADEVASLTEANKELAADYQALQEATKADPADEVEVAEEEETPDDEPEVNVDSADSAAGPRKAKPATTRKTGRKKK